MYNHSLPWGVACAIKTHTLHKGTRILDSRSPLTRSLNMINIVVVKNSNSLGTILTLNAVYMRLDAGYTHCV